MNATTAHRTTNAADQQSEAAHATATGLGSLVGGEVLHGLDAGAGHIAARTVSRRTTSPNCAVGRFTVEAAWRGFADGGMG